MEQDVKKALDEITEIVEENNKIVKKLHSAAMWSRFFRIMYWSVIIFIAMGAYYYIQPYLDKAGLTWGILKENIDNIQRLGSFVPKN